MELIPIPACTIRTRILRDTFGTAMSDDDVLNAMAALAMTTLEVVPKTLEESLSEDYPWSPIHNRPNVDRHCLEDLLQTIRQWSRLRSINLTTAAVTVSGLWDTSDDRGLYPYWIHKWNNHCREFGPLESMSNEKRELVNQVCRRLGMHPEVTRVVFLGSGPRPPKLEEIRWLWHRELQLLTLRGMLAFALMGAYRALPYFDREVSNKGRPEIVARVRRELEAARRFVCGDHSEIEPLSEDSIFPPDYDNPFHRDGVLTLEMGSALGVGVALAGAVAVSKYMASHDDVDAVVCINSVADVSFWLVPDDYVALLRLRSGKFLEVGKPIPLQPDGQLDVC